MSNSPEVAMTVIEPGGRRWAQLLNLTWPVRELLPLIVERLDLPKKLNYELQHVRSGHRLGDGDSLRSFGAAPGDEFLIRPMRDKLFIDLTDALYGEAVGYVAKQLWGQVESRLETIFRLDPDYPDPKGVRPALAAARGAAGGPTASTAPPAGGGSATPPPYTSGPSAAPSYTAGAAAPQPQPATMQPVVEATKPGRSACGIVVIVLGVFVLLGLALAVASYSWFMRRLAEPAGVLIPTLISEPDFDSGGINEPVLGTGDVQVTLRWDGPADLDLHVIDPGGEEIYFSSPISSSGGQLDVDANGTCAGDPPVENVFWPTGGAPSGNYQVSVNYYGGCGQAEPVNYEVTVLVDGQTVDVRSGTLTSEGETQLIGEFTR